MLLQVSINHIRINTLIFYQEGLFLRVLKQTIMDIAYKVVTMKRNPQVQWSKKKGTV